MNLAFSLSTVSIVLGLLLLVAIEAPYTLDGYIRILMRRQFEAERRREKRRSGRRLLLFRF